MAECMSARSTPAAAAAASPTVVYDMDQDFFVQFKLTRGRHLGRGMAGDVFLATSVSRPERRLAVKTYALTDDVREQNMRHFTTEVGVMQVSEAEH